MTLLFSNIKQYGALFILIMQHMYNDKLIFIIYTQKCAVSERYYYDNLFVTFAFNESLNGFSLTFSCCIKS